MSTPEIRLASLREQIMQDPFNMELHQEIATLEWNCADQVEKTAIQVEKTAIDDCLTEIQTQSLEESLTTLNCLSDQYPFNSELTELIITKKQELSTLMRNRAKQVEETAIADCLAEIQTQSLEYGITALECLSSQYPSNSELINLIRIKKHELTVLQAVELFNAPVRADSLKPW